MSNKRQKSQLELAFTYVGKGEALTDVRKGPNR